VRLAHLTAIGLPVLQNFDPLHVSAPVERNRVIDIEMLADHMVDHEQAERVLAGLCFPGSAVQRGEIRRRRKGEFLRLRHRKVLDRIGGCSDGSDQCGWCRKPDPVSHRFVLVSVSKAAVQKKKPTPPRNESDRAPAGSRLITFWYVALSTICGDGKIATPALWNSVCPAPVGTFKSVPAKPPA